MHSDFRKRFPLGAATVKRLVATGGVRQESGGSMDARSEDPLASKSFDSIRQEGEAWVNGNAASAGMP